MACKKCIESPVITLPNSNVNLCRGCFIKYFERKVQKTITQYKLIEKGDKIAVACSGGKDSTSLLYLLKKLSSKMRNEKIIAIAVDEGIEGYRNKKLKFLDKFCKENRIELSVYSFKKEFGKTLDEILEGYKGIPCSICGVLRRYLLNKKSKELKVNKLATGHNLDDEAQSIVMNYFRRNIKVSARLGPITGVVSDKRFVRRIKPFYFLTEKEVATYAFLKGFMDEFNECPYNVTSYRNYLREVLNEFENKYPGTKHNIISSFLEILPLLKEHYKDSKDIKNCKVCEEPCSQGICKACQYMEEIVKISK